MESEHKNGCNNVDCNICHSDLKINGYSVDSLMDKDNDALRHIFNRMLYYVNYIREENKEYKSCIQDLKSISSRK